MTDAESGTVLNVPVDEEEENTYSETDPIIKLALVANNVAWISLIVFSLFGLSSLISILMQAYQAKLWTHGLTALLELTPVLTAVIILCLGGFLFVMLRAISEGLFVLLDIRENTRGKAG